MTGGGGAKAGAGGSAGTTGGGGVSSGGASAGSGGSGGVAGGGSGGTIGGVAGSGGATAGTSGGGAGGKGGSGGKAGSSGGGNGGSNGGGGAGGKGGSGGGGGGVTDPFEILEKLRPSGSAGNDYDDWMDEIGTPVVATTAGADGNIKAPILVPAGVIYDGKGQTIKPSISGCTGSQTESQPPVFILVPGAGLKNVTISPPACDGVHMVGNNTLENVVWTDVGEDAASVRSYLPGGKISIKFGSLKSADDKAFQFNSPVQGFQISRPRASASDYKDSNRLAMVRIAARS